MRTTYQMVIALLATLVLASCGSTGERAKTFEQRGLPALVLRADDAPSNLRYEPRQSGSGVLEEQGMSQRSMSVLRGYGFESDYGRQFYGRNARKGIFSLASAAALFRDRNGAGKALMFLKERLVAQNPAANEVASPGLGDDAWGLAGRFFANAPPNFTAVYYAWRVDNVVQTLAMTGTKSAVNEKRARALAKKLEARATS